MDETAVQVSGSSVRPGGLLGTHHDAVGIHGYACSTCEGVALALLRRSGAGDRFFVGQILIGHRSTPFIHVGNFAEVVNLAIPHVLFLHAVPSRWYEVVHKDGHAKSAVNGHVF